METIVGTILAIEETGGGRFQVELAPVCLLPRQEAVPKALRGAVLTVEREVADGREIGGIGDSIVLTPRESTRWLSPPGRMHWLENAWSRIEITCESGGAILSWQERGRDIDHFAQPEERIGDPLDIAGHVDCFHTECRLRTIRATAKLEARRHEMGVDRLFLSGRARRSVETSLECALFDELPLLWWRRTFRLKEIDVKRKGPSQLIDAVRPFGVGFRAAWLAERFGDDGSRLLCTYDDRLVIIRGALVNYREGDYNWRMAGGWALAEHPGRRACSLYLFDPQQPPECSSWMYPLTMTLEPIWPLALARAGDTLTLSLGMVHGECCGAGVAGAWIGCRTMRVECGMRCAMIGRFVVPPAEVTVQVGEEAVSVQVRTFPLPGAGDCHYALADFPHGRLHDPLEIIVPGLPQRRAR